MANSFDFGSELKPLSAFSMSGLADIILLLLIFFILTSSFVTQFGIQVSLPKAETGATIDQQFVRVTITDEGNYFVQGEPADKDQLLTRIREAESESPVLLLRADEDATVGQFATVANVAKALNMRVLMATERESGRR